MIEINVPDYNDEEFSDGSPTYAVLNIRGTKIVLNIYEVDDLRKAIEDFTKPQYCYQCKNFIMNKWGVWKHGGSCCKDEEIDIKDAGYKNCVDCQHTCKYFEEA